MPGRFKDYVAMPKFSMYRSLRDGHPGPEEAARDPGADAGDARDGRDSSIAAHWVYKGPKGRKAEAERLALAPAARRLAAEETDSRELMRAFPGLASDEVYVFTPKGEVKNLPAGATPIDFAYSVHTDMGHRTVGAKVNGRIVPLHYRLKSGDFVEILTSKQASRGPSRDWLSLAASSRA